MPNPVTVEDLRLRYPRPIATEDEAGAQEWLDDAWALLVSRRPTLEADIASGTVLLANARRVTCAMVRRVLLNPEGHARENLGEYGYQRADSAATGELEVTAAELADLTVAAHRSVTSVRMRTARYGEV